jgi:hypothetical protein
MVEIPNAEPAASTGRGDCAAIACARHAAFFRAFQTCSAIMSAKSSMSIFELLAAAAVMT